MSIKKMNVEMYETETQVTYKGIIFKCNECGYKSYTMGDTPFTECYCKKIKKLKKRISETDFEDKRLCLEYQLKKLEERVLRYKEAKGDNE